MGLFFAGTTRAGQEAVGILRSLGIPIDSCPDSGTRELLTDVPCFLADGSIRGEVPLADYLESVPSSCILYGGNLNHPLVKDCKKVDFLQDPRYLAINAAITADCTMLLAQKEVPKLTGLPVLVIGWGRIGKCLSGKLREAGADVTLAARKETDLALGEALGYHTLSTEYLSDSVHHYKVIFNTVPHTLLEKSQLSGDALKIDLASVRGLPGEDVIWARGLPGTYAPEASGRLIAETYLRKGVFSWK